MIKEIGGMLTPEQVVEGMLELIKDTSKAGAVMRVTVRGGRDYWPPQRPRPTNTTKANLWNNNNNNKDQSRSLYRWSADAIPTTGYASAILF